MLLDTVLVIILIVCMLVGLWLGVVRQFFILAGVYLGLVVAHFAHQQLASLMAVAAAQPRLISLFSPIAYLLLLLLTVALVTLLSFREYEHMPEGGPFAGDRLAGAAIGVIWGLFLIGGVAMAADHFVESNPAGVSDETKDSFRRTLQESRMRPVLLETTPGLREALRFAAPNPL